jgi:hypothetical protein
LKQRAYCCKDRTDCHGTKYEVPHSDVLCCGDHCASIVATGCAIRASKGQDGLEGGSFYLL